MAMARSDLKKKRTDFQASISIETQSLSRYRRPCRHVFIIRTQAQGTSKAYRFSIHVPGNSIPIHSKEVNMDEAQALRILSALASGINPVTGEVFPKDSPYQSPDIIRALFVATRGLEAGAQRMPPSSPPSPSRPAEPARNPANGNAGKSWSAEEDRQLLAAFDGGK